MRPFAPPLEALVVPPPTRETRDPRHTHECIYTVWPATRQSRTEERRWIPGTDLNETQESGAPRVALLAPERSRRASSASSARRRRIEHRAPFAAFRVAIRRHLARRRRSDETTLSPSSRRARRVRIGPEERREKRVSFCFFRRRSARFARASETRRTGPSRLRRSRDQLRSRRGSPSRAPTAEGPGQLRLVFAARVRRDCLKTGWKRKLSDVDATAERRLRPSADAGFDPRSRSVSGKSRRKFPA